MVTPGPQKQKETFGVRAAGCVSFNWLVGGEATELCSRNLVLSLKLPSSTWVGAPVLQNSKYCYACFLSKNQDLASRLYPHLIVLLFLYPLPSLISNCLNLPFVTQGRSRRLNEAYILQTRNGEHRTDLYSRVPQSPAQFNSGNQATMTVITFCQNGA